MLGNGLAPTWGRRLWMVRARFPAESRAALIALGMKFAGYAMPFRTGSDTQGRIPSMKAQMSSGPGRK